MKKIEATINTILIGVIVAYFFLTHSYNEELTERVSNLENMVKESDSDGIVYERYLERAKKVVMKRLNE